MYRISPSMLDGLEFYRGYDGMSMDEFLIRVKGEDNENRWAAKTDAGKTLHKMLETASVGDSIEEIDGNVSINCDVGIEAFPVRELKAVKVIQTRFGPVAVSGMADAINGNEVIDYKVTFSFMPDEKFLDSVQWRIYLWMFSCESFRYIVFRGSETKSKGMCINDISTILLFRYPDMENDIIRRVEDYINFIVANGLEHLIDRGDDSCFIPDL